MANGCLLYAVFFFVVVIVELFFEAIQLDVNNVQRKNLKNVSENFGERYNLEIKRHITIL